MIKSLPGIDAQSGPQSKMGEQKVLYFSSLNFQTRLWENEGFGEQFLSKQSAVSWEGLEEQPVSVCTFLHPYAGQVAPSPSLLQPQLKSERAHDS